MFARSKAIAIMLAIYAPIAQAQDAGSARPYSFSGACSSQGLWTQEALQTTNTLRNFTLQMKNDPSCKALGDQTQLAIQKLETMVRPPIAENYTARLAQLPQEISAFRSYLTSDNADMQGPVKDTMMRKMIEMSTLRSSVSAKTGIATEVGAAVGEAMGGPVGGAVGAMVGGTAGTLGGQFNYSTQQGLSVFNQVIDSLPQMQTCLTGGDVAAGQMVAASVKLLTAFAASGQDSTGTGLATAISKLTTAMRDMHFAKTLRTLNQADFLASMACLVEMTSENYCTTRDSKMLFEDMMKQIQARPRDQELQRVGVNSPLAGYYILTQNLPMITNWIQRVQTGVEPRLPTDAVFQNKIFDEVNNFFKKVKDIEGTFSMDVQAMKVIPDERGRKNAARSIVMKLSDIISPQNFGSGSELRNFFDLKGSAKEIPFFLMGVEIPDQVRGIGTAQQEPGNFLEVNYMNYAPLADPVALMGVVQSNLNDLVKTAQTNAIQYYNKWFIVDKISLVNESLLGTNYSVKQSLILTSDYLSQVEQRMRANGAEASMIGAIQDTRSKIRRVLNAYDELERVSKALVSGGDSLSTEDRKTIENANLQIISSVYDEFEVLLGKSGWFQNRIVKFVYADYLLQLKGNQGYGEAINDLYYATGLSIFDQIVMTAGGNPAKVQNDLSLALRLNKMNLEAVENLIRDDFAATTADLKGVAKISKNANAVNGNVSTHVSTWDRAYKDSLVELPGENSWKITRIFKGIWAGVREEVKSAPSAVPFWGANFANRKYVAANERYAMDDEFGSSYRLYQQFCIQSLAFGDLRSFYQLCHNSVLKSPFESNFLASLTADQTAALSTSYDKKLVESRDKPQLNASKRICAFRDYNRKNLVVYLTTAQKTK